VLRRADLGLNDVDRQILPRSRPATRYQTDSARAWGSMAVMQGRWSIVGRKVNAGKKLQW
jgi:hypothetical protein